VQPLEQHEQRGRDDGEYAVIDDQVETLGQRLQRVLDLGPGVELDLDVAGRAGRDRQAGDDHSCRIKAVVELARIKLARRLRLLGRKPRGDEVVLDHPHPAVVGIFGERRLAARIAGELVQVAEFDFLEFVGLVVNDRPDVRRGRHRVLLALRFGIAGELEIRVRCDRRRARIGDRIVDVDHIAAAVKSQRLHDLVAVGGARLQLELQGVCAGCQLARAGHGLPQRAVIGQAFAEQARLRDERAVGIFLQQEIRPGLVLGVAVFVQRNLGDDRTGGIDVGGVEVGPDRDRFAGRRCGRRGVRVRSDCSPGHRRGCGYGRFGGRAGRSLRDRRWRRPMLALPRLPQE
jgi:hypothetical protein